MESPPLDVLAERVMHFLTFKGLSRLLQKIGFKLVDIMRVENWKILEIPIGQHDSVENRKPDLNLNN